MLEFSSVIFLKNAVGGLRKSCKFAAVFSRKTQLENNIIKV